MAEMALAKAACHATSKQLKNDFKDLKNPKMEYGYLHTSNNPTVIISPFGGCAVLYDCPME